MAKQLTELAKATGRKELHWIAGKKHELDVFRVPLQHLYFNIENGRYADRMFRLRQENPGVEIDPSKEKWASEIEKMLAGEHRETTQDKSAFERLLSDIEEREQLRPGVVKFDGGVIDGNRRFAALRRLNKSNTKTGRLSYFEAVILPKETTDEDLWRIEAGLQLGIDERWDYSPINELLKIREGLRLYGTMIAQGKYSGKSAVQLVSQSIYGRSEADIKERAERLHLIDDYLAFVGKKGEYDFVGRTSERFLEAAKILRAARNQQYDGKRLAKLQAVLFYLIHTEKIKNWDLRPIYEAMGGDPKRKGPKPQRNTKAFDDFIAGFPDIRELQARLVNPGGGTPAPPKTTPLTSTKRASKDSKSSKPSISKDRTPAAREVDEKADVAIERFKATMEASKGTKSPRQLVEAALAPLKALQESLSKKNVRDHLDEDDKERASVEKGLETIGALQKECLDNVRGKKPSPSTRQKK